MQTDCPKGRGLDRRAVLVGLAASGLLACVQRRREPAGERTVTVFFGTYTAGNSPSKGIYTGRFDLDTGTLTAVTLASASTNPSYIALHPSGRFLYAVNEVSDFEGNAERSAAWSRRRVSPLSRAFLRRLEL